MRRKDRPPPERRYRHKFLVDKREQMTYNENSRCERRKANRMTEKQAWELISDLTIEEIEQLHALLLSLQQTRLPEQLPAV